MTIFDSIKYPFADWAQARLVYETLPAGIKSKYQEWWKEDDNYKPREAHIAKLRQIILEYEE